MPGRCLLNAWETPEGSLRRRPKNSADVSVNGPIRQGAASRLESPFLLPPSLVSRLFIAEPTLLRSVCVEIFLPTLAVGRSFASSSSLSPSLGLLGSTCPCHSLCLPPPSTVVGPCRAPIRRSACFSPAGLKNTFLCSPHRVSSGLKPPSRYIGLSSRYLGLQLLSSILPGHCPPPCCFLSVVPPRKGPRRSDPEFCQGSQPTPLLFYQHSRIRVQSLYPKCVLCLVFSFCASSCCWGRSPPLGHGAHTAKYCDGPVRTPIS